jgi:hypothetical protein
MTLSASAQIETIEKTIYVSVTNFGVTAPNNITDPLTYDENFTVVGYNLNGVEGNLTTSFDETTGLYKFTVSYEHDITSNINNVVVDNRLSQNYPNPFESETRFDVNATESESYNISVYDMSGTLVNKYDFYLSKGLHNFTFDGGVSGNYILCVNSKTYSERIKMTCVGNNSYINISHNGISENVVENDVVYNTKSTMEDVIINCEETSIIDILAFVGGYEIKLEDLYVLDLVDDDTLYIEYHLFIDNRPDGYSENSFNVYPYYNVYNTTLIDGEYYMIENMRYLPYVSYPDTTYECDKRMYVYGYVDGDNVETAMNIDEYDTYGVLYNYVAVITDSVCPDGWRLPITEDFSNFTEMNITNYINNQFGGSYEVLEGFHGISNFGAWNVENYNQLWLNSENTLNIYPRYHDTASSVRCVKD